jgi:dihydropteroate synthase
MAPDSAQAAIVVARGRRIELGARPLLMGVLNATPDSFSDSGLFRTVGERVERGLALVAEGADIIDVGGESAVTNRPAVSAEEEIERVTPVIEGLLARADVLVSVDTYKPAVARAAIAAGASIVNDISGLRDVGLAQACAQSGAALVVMHTRAVPKQRVNDPDLYEDVVADVLRFLRERTALAQSHGVPRESLIVDPGPDFAKTPAQTIEVLRELDALGQLGLPILMAISRKDFIGALVGKPPRARLAGTLAALDHGARHGAHIFRVHDIAEARAFIDARMDCAYPTT